MSQLPGRERAALRLQRWISWANAFWFVGGAFLLLKLVGRYHCPEVVALRKQARALMVEAKGQPVLICANHLTSIDSMIINWLLFSWVDYLRQWRLMPWNMPEFGNFAGSVFLKIAGYLGKCVYIVRGGGLVQRRATLAKVKELLLGGDLVCIFPEGTRSRTGRINDSTPTYSVGEIFLEVPNTVILCVYCRGVGQVTWGAVPRPGESFHVEMQLFRPTTVQLGRRGAKDIAEQTMATLCQMENRFFDIQAARNQSMNPSSKTDSHAYV